jgi:serine/threonine protein kinase
MELKHAAIQLGEARKVKKVDVASKYTIGEPVLCQPMETKQLTCVKNINKPALLIYPHGGPTLHKTLKRMTTVKDINNFLMNFGKLVEGVADMNAKNLFHLDIKGVNIVTGPDGQGPYRLIDFGLSVSYPESYIHPSLFNNPYRYRPMDAILLSDNLMMSDIINHVDQVLEKDKELLWFYNVASRRNAGSVGPAPNIQKAAEMINEILIVLGSSSTDYQVLRKIDVFSLGHILLETIYYERISLKNYGAIYDAILQLLLDSNVLHFDTRYRCDTETFARLYKEHLGVFYTKA